MPRYHVAPGVTRLQADAPRINSAKRVSHWLTAMLPQPKRKPKVVPAQQAMF